MSRPVKSPWAVVLAAGDGARLRPLTRLLYEQDLPKQFAVIEGGRSLLQSTLDRLAARFPAERTVVVVGKSQETVARHQLGDFAGVEIVAQPRNLGTGPGLLLPLARVRARDPGARVAVFPSDHYVPRPERLLEGIETALEAVDRSGLALIGVEPDRPETEYGWIVPESNASTSAAGIQIVHRFVEKPERPLAERLLRQGALWNTFICVGRLQEFWEEARLHMPRTARLFNLYAEHAGQPDEGHVLEEIYSRIEPANFSRDVLERARGLGVVPVRDSGWSDWGSPRRIFESLRGMADRQRLLTRIATVRRTRAVLLAAAAPDHVLQGDDAGALPA